jgi:hypothetical protein
MGGGLKALAAREERFVRGSAEAQTRQLRACLEDLTTSGLAGTSPVEPALYAHRPFRAQPNGLSIDGDGSVKKTGPVSDI